MFCVYSVRYSQYPFSSVSQDEVDSLNQNKPKPKDAPSAKLSVDQYIDIQNAYDEALSASLNGIGGKHAILIAALKRVGILAMSWQEAEKLAQDILSKGYSHE